MQKNSALPASYRNAGSVTASDTPNSQGFSLLELLIVISIIGILSAIALPIYSQHITHANRWEAEISLAKTAVALEQYHLVNNTYKNATLEKLNIHTIKNYQLEITHATDTEFVLAAHPLTTTDTCATLLLNSTGEKNQTGTATTEECW